MNTLNTLQASVLSAPPPPPIPALAEPLAADDLAAALMLRKYRAWRQANNECATRGNADASARPSTGATTDGVAAFLASTELAPQA